VWVNFLYCNKIPETIHLQRKKVYSGSQHWKFPSMIRWPCCFEPVARQHITAEQNHSPQSQEAKREEEAGWQHTPNNLKTSH
jgi:hypothetical protein